MGLDESFPNLEDRDWNIWGVLCGRISVGGLVEKYERGMGGGSSIEWR